MRLTPILCCALLLATASCSTRSPEAVADPLERDFGRLPLVQATQRIEESELFLDITVENPFAETVEGVRVLYRVLVSKDPESLEIARTQHESDAVLAPGARTQVSILLPRQAGQRGSFGAFAHAFAQRRGATDMPLPPLWRVE